MSGLAGILIMSMLCDHGVDVYGFDTGHEPPNTPYHYYDEGVPNNKLDEADDSKRMLARLRSVAGECIRLHD